ncbi:MAG TPA: hypothetical protein VMC41_04410 [Candidatus Nanoarchaeia archaeon]|nr:hypothetical protein [Candidatus Nanoarchaeia archaeon]
MPRKKSRKTRLFKAVAKLLDIGNFRRNERLAKGWQKFCFGGIRIDIRLGFIFCQLRLGRETYTYGPLKNILLDDLIKLSVK